MFNAAHVLCPFPLVRVPPAKGSCFQEKWNKNVNCIR